PELLASGVKEGHSHGAKKGHGGHKHGGADSEKESAASHPDNGSDETANPPVTEATLHHAAKKGSSEEPAEHTQYEGQKTKEKAANKDEHEHHDKQRSKLK